MHWAGGWLPEVSWARASAQGEGDGSSRAWPPGRRARACPLAQALAAPRRTRKGGARPTSHPSPQAAAPRIRGRGASSQDSGCTGRQDVHLLAGLEQGSGLREGEGPSCYCPLLLLPQRNKGQRWPGVPDLKSQQQRDEGAFASCVCVYVFQRGVCVCQSRVCVCVGGVSQSGGWSTRPERGWKDGELSCVREQSSRPQSDSWAWGRQSGGR